MNAIALRRDNPRLLELEAAYRASPHFDTLLKGSAWETFERGLNPQQFRSEAQYQTQLLFGATPEKYRNTFDYVRSIDTEGYLERLGEDSDFGCITFEFDGVTVSRDKLDAILEIYALRETLGLNDDERMKVLDLGAGYGRFAHRFVDAFPLSGVFCADAVPISTFLCDFYIQYRSMRHVWATRLDKIAETDFPNDIGLAVNIHSFSEMKLDAINFWLDFVCDLGIKYLFIVPHDDRWVSVNPDGSHPSFKPAIQAHGYRLVRERPKFPAGVDGIYPEAVYSFWEKS